MNGTCTNTAGSFECVCNDGYFGKGRNCSGSHPDPKIRGGGGGGAAGLPPKNKGKAAPRALPLDPPLICHWGGGGGTGLPPKNKGVAVPPGPSPGSATELRPQFPLTNLLTLFNHIV